MRTKLNPEVSRQVYGFDDQINHRELQLLDQLTRVNFENIALTVPYWIIPIFIEESKRREMILLLNNAHEVLELILQAKSHLSAVLTYVGSDDPFEILLDIIELSEVHLSHPKGWLMIDNDNHCHRLKYDYDPTEDIVNALVWLQHNYELVNKQIDAIKYHRIPRQRMKILQRIKKLAKSDFYKLLSLLNSDQMQHPPSVLRLMKTPTDLLIQ